MQQWLTTEFTMHDVNIGSKPPSDAKRDAIHFACAPVKSADRFLPGEHVGLNDKGEAAQVDNPIGIIDPFLKRAVEPGDPVWIMLYPKTVQNLRHDWDHPAFDAAMKNMENTLMAASVEWVKEYAAVHCQYDLDNGGKENAYNHFIANAKAGNIFYHGSDLHSLEELDDKDNLFHHLSVILGRPVNGLSFTYSCSC